MDNDSSCLADMIKQFLNEHTLAELLEMITNILKDRGY